MSAFEEAYLPKTEPDEEALIGFGFTKKGDGFLYECEILGGGFLLQVSVDGNQAHTRLLEKETHEPYEVYRVESAHGDYVGAVREAIKDVLLEIRNRCYPVSWTKRKQPAAILDYIHNAFGEREEFPWEEYDFAITRRSDNRKWYAVFMNIPVSKVGIREDRQEVILNIAHDGQEVDHKVFYPAYHMNKRTWVSMVLDGSVPTEKIITYLEESRARAGMAKNSKKK